MSTVLIGLDLREGLSPSGLCLATSYRRPDDGEYHFEVRILERLEGRNRLPDVAARLAEIEAGARRKARDAWVTTFVNLTGKGEPALDVLASKTQGRLRPVYFNHGDQRTDQGSTITLGKAWLVSRLKALLQTHRIHLPRTAEWKSLCQELLDYEVKVEGDANDRYGFFSVGPRDELVMALGLALQVDTPATGGSLPYVPGW